jgi:hypothetical protein
MKAKIGIIQISVDELKKSLTVTVVLNIDFARRLRQTFNYPLYYNQANDCMNYDRLQTLESTAEIELIIAIIYDKEFFALNLYLK